jgi:hypothetical protein
MNLISALTGPTSVSWATHFGGMAVGYAYIKFVPLLRERFSRRRRSRPAQNDPMDKLGEAIDNIFKFEEEKKRRK